MTTLYSSSFTVADQALNGYDGWTTRYGTYDIVSNRVSLTTNPGSSLVCVYNSTGITGADYSFQSVCRDPTGGGSWYGNGVRRANYSTDDSDAYISLLNRSYNELRLYKRLSGGYTQLGSYAVSLATDTDYTVKTSANGSTIKSFLDGTERISVTDTAITAAGSCCFTNATGGTGTGYIFDDALAEDFAAATTSPFPPWPQRVYQLGR